MSSGLFSAAAWRPVSFASLFLLAASLPTHTLAGITIGAGPAIGTDKRGTTWYEEFQDWTASDVKALDPNNDQYKFNTSDDPGRDLIAFYARVEGDYVFFRADFFDLGFGQENGGVDLYVAIDCAPGGQVWFPDNLDVKLPAFREWDVCVAVYNGTAGAIYNTAFTNVGGGGNFLGSYWRSDLDGVEFGIKKSVLTAAGWNGTSPLYFRVVTARDGTIGGPGEIGGADVVDSMSGPGGYLARDEGGGTGTLYGPGFSSSDVTGRAKYAVIAHANQSVATVDGTQGHIYTNRGDLNLHPGFIRTIESHAMLKAPLNMHLSGSLLSSLLWARQDPSAPGYPERDGPTFVNRLKEMVQSGTGSIIGGVYAEHIMPYFEGAPNRASIAAFNDLALHLFNLSTDDMKVMHVPERVFHHNTSWAVANPAGPLKGRPFDDVTAGGYAATYLDEVTHLHHWFYPNEQSNPGWDDNNFGRWAGGQGNDEEPYHHKIHKINGVLTFMINDREDQSKFGNDDGGMAKDTRYTLLDKALSPDSSKITIVFDDWEAFAGNSFASSTPNNNADQWHTTIRWAANHPWIHIVHLKDVVTWAQGDPSWVVDQGNAPANKSLQTYEWLKRASEHSYDNWYYGSPQEESFYHRVPMVGPDGWKPGGMKRYGDMNTPGSLVRDSWDRVAAMPPGSLRKLAEWTYSAMIYETAWHDEDANPDHYQSRNYQATFNRIGEGIYSTEDTTWDPISYWALRLHGHIRKVGIHADAAAWVAAIRSGSQGAATVVEAKDVDDDQLHEYILRNDRVYLCFERWGARLVYAFTYDPATQEAHQVIGVPVANPSEEHEGEGADNNRCSGFKDRYASGTNDHRYVDMDYADTPPVQGTDSWEFRSKDGKITKRVSLPRGRDVVRADYALGSGVGTLYIRHGLGPNQLDLLRNGDANLTASSDAWSIGLANSQGGAAFAVRGRNASRMSGNLASAGYRNRNLPLIEQVEVYNTAAATSFSTSLAFSKSSADDIDGDGLTNAAEQTAGTDFDNSDTDGDGMADGFEVAHNLNPLSPGDAGLDPDGDGQSNRQEFLAGTSPNSATSVFRITQSVLDGDRRVSLTWTATAGRRYQIQHKASLAATDWTALGTVTASSALGTYLTAPSVAPAGFYRVTVLP